MDLHWFWSAAGEQILTIYKNILRIVELWNHYFKIVELSNYSISKIVENNEL